MSKSESSRPSSPGISGGRLSFRADGDRGCPNCGEIALAFDPSAERARCRACGTTV
ncbi:hypothetical protein [Halosimplex sp. J119]